MTDTNRLRRNFLKGIGAIGGLLAIGSAKAHHTETHFEDESEYKIVYQLNKADESYIGGILFSAGEMIRKYGDNVEVVIAVYGPGLHLLLKEPKRPIAEEHQQRVSSLNAYGVSFHACGNTMKALHVEEKDLLDVAKIVPIGVDDIMQLQRAGFSYISW